MTDHIFMMKARFAPLLTALVACVLGACDSEEKVDYPDDCVPAPSNSPLYPVDHISSVGYSGEDVFNLINASRVGELSWHTGETTSVKFEATNSSGFAQVNNPPPYQGYCAPSISLPFAQVELSTDDERLDFRIAATISSRGGSGILDSVSVRQSHYLPQQVPWLEVPEELHSAQRSLDWITLSLRAQGASQESPFCLQDDVVSERPEVACNTYDGTIVFHSVNPDVPANDRGPDDEISVALAWWNWQ